MSWEQWEAHLFLKKSKKNFLPWHGLFINLCRGLLVRGEQESQLQNCKYSPTSKQPFADLFFSYPRWQHSFKAPTKALAHKVWTFHLTSFTVWMQVHLVLQGVGRRRQEGTAEPSVECCFRGNSCPALLVFSLCVPNTDHQEGLLRWSYFWLPRKFPPSLKDSSQNWE